MRVFDLPTLSSSHLYRAVRPLTSTRLRIFQGLQLEHRKSRYFQIVLQRAGIPKNSTSRLVT